MLMLLDDELRDKEVSAVPALFLLVNDHVMVF